VRNCRFEFCADIAWAANNPTSFSLGQLRVGAALVSFAICRGISDEFLQFATYKNPEASCMQLKKFSLAGQ
jgi:hypothetical protein